MRVRTLGRRAASHYLEYRTHHSNPLENGSESDSPRHCTLNHGIVIEWSHDMHDFPETGFLRLPQVLSVIPLGKTSWWEGVKAGRFPKPVKLSARCTAWRAEDIRELIKILS